MVRKKRWRVLIGMIFLNLAFFMLCLQLVMQQNSVSNDVKWQAVYKAVEAQQAIGDMIQGEEYTPITTTLGAVQAKQLSRHPDFAALIVELLEQAAVQPGDAVAVNVSGSFPALNVAALAAVDAMQARPVLISSAGASTWGANRPDYTWLDIEAELAGKGIWQWRSAAVSMGGGSDQGKGLTEEGQEMLRQAMERSGRPALVSNSLEEAIEQRIRLYKKENSGHLPKVLINVGGSHVIFGTHGHDASLRQGLTQGYRPSLAQNDGLAACFIENHRSVIHLINIQRLAAEYDIHVSSAVGSSKAFYSLSLPIGMRVLLGVWLIGMLILLYEGMKKEWWRERCYKN